MIFGGSCPSANQNILNNLNFWLRTVCLIFIGFNWILATATFAMKTEKLQPWTVPIHRALCLQFVCVHFEIFIIFFFLFVCGGSMRVLCILIVDLVCHSFFYIYVFALTLLKSNGGVAGGDNILSSLSIVSFDDCSSFVSLLINVAGITFSCTISHLFLWPVWFFLSFFLLFLQTLSWPIFSLCLIANICGWFFFVSLSSLFLNISLEKTIFQIVLCIASSFFACVRNTDWLHIRSVPHPVFE